MRKHFRRLSAIAAALLLIFALSAASAATYATLRYGSSGSAVTRLQQALSTLGYSVGKIDGKYGAYTENAVRSFQRANGLQVDGVAGTKTQTAIYAAISGGSATATPTVRPTVTPRPTATPASSGSAIFGGNYTTMRRGSSGTRVVTLQNALNQLGYSCGRADGIYGSGTYSAVVRFQSTHGLSTDGVAGPATLRAIESALAGTTPTAAPTATVRPTATAVVTATPASGTVWTAPGTTLRPGSVGTDVLSLQLRLQSLGWFTGTPNGNYGSTTTAAVAAFQARCGLTADGIAGPKTYARLALSSAPTAGTTPTVTATPVPQVTATPVPVATATVPPSLVNTTLRKGMSGAAVEALQKALAFLDYATSTYGTYDNATAAAVKSFQTKNGLSQDGIAGPLTLSKVYSASAVHGDSSAGIADNVGVMTNPPSVSQLQLLHWVNDIKPTLKNGQTLLIYDPVTGLAWTLRLMSLGRHADVEPLTAVDTAIQFRAFGNRSDWGPKPVYVQLPSGVWTVATMHNVAHGTQTIRTNNYDGQNCVHFLRDMAEAQKNDPNYGVSNQTTLREYWLKLTGQTIDY